jgi:hypothetical protein
VFALLGAFALVACSELYWLYERLSHTAGAPHPSSSMVLSYVSMGLVLAANLGLVTVIGKLGRTTAFAAGLGVLMVVRSLSTMGMMARATEARPPMWVYPLLGIISLLVSCGVGALALHARQAVGPAAPVSGAAPPPITEASGMRLILTGTALLVLGIGGSVISYSVASSGSGGGRYVIATGAIATGLVQLVRGLGRLGR